MNYDDARHLLNLLRLLKLRSAADRTVEAAFSRLEMWFDGGHNTYYSAAPLVSDGESDEAR